MLFKRSSFSLCRAKVDSGRFPCEDCFCLVVDLLVCTVRWSCLLGDRDSATFLVSCLVAGLVGGSCLFPAPFLFILSRCCVTGRDE